MIDQHEVIEVDGKTYYSSPIMCSAVLVGVAIGLLIGVFL